jgi:hypothetical protein
MQADQSLWPPLYCGGRISRFLQTPQNAACVLVECGARLGEMRAARGAMKQADAKILFKAGDRARDGRCLGIRGNCSFRKAADLYRSHEHTQRAQIVHFGASVSPLLRNVEHSPDQPFLRFLVFRRPTLTRRSKFFEFIPLVKPARPLTCSAGLRFAY